VAQFRPYAIPLSIGALALVAIIALFAGLWAPGKRDEVPDVPDSSPSEATPGGNPNPPLVKPADQNASGNAGNGGARTPELPGKTPENLPPAARSEALPESSKVTPPKTDLSQAPKLSNPVQPTRTEVPPPPSPVPAQTPDKNRIEKAKPVPASPIPGQSIGGRSSKVDPRALREAEENRIAREKDMALEAAARAEFLKKAAEQEKPRDIKPFFRGTPAR
jgi:cell division septation protein DedD